MAPEITEKAISPLVAFEIVGLGTIFQHLNLRFVATLCHLPKRAFAARQKIVDMGSFLPFAASWTNDRSAKVSEVIF